MAALLTCGGTLASLAQTDLTGRSYQNLNIMEEEMAKMLKEVDSKMDSMRTVAINKAKTEKGRELTAEEMTEVDQTMAKARKMMESMKKAMTIGISVEFTSPKDLVMRTHMSVDDNALKLAGVSWVKRKAMKAALAVMPEKQKATYEVRGEQVIIDDGEEKDTMRLSSDGKYLHGTFDEKTPFKLTRK